MEKKKKTTTKKFNPTLDTASSLEWRGKEVGGREVEEWREVEGQQRPKRFWLWWCGLPVADNHPSSCAAASAVQRNPAGGKCQSITAPSRRGQEVQLIQCNILCSNSGLVRQIAPTPPTGVVLPVRAEDSRP